MFFNFFKRYDLLTFSHEKESIEVFKEIGLREFKKVLFLDLEEKNPCVLELNIRRNSCLRKIRGIRMRICIFNLF
jgi:hypothetical protein